MIRIPETPEYFSMPCRSCDSTKVRLVIDLGDQAFCNRLVKADAPQEPTYPLRLGYCEACTLLQIDHTIPRDDMFREYVYVSGTTKTLAKHFADTTDRLATTYNVQPSDLVVDIGSNDGTWLKNWHDRARGIGIEPSFNVSAMATGVHTINDYFDLRRAKWVREAYGPAKLITSAGSFFHMEDLHGACDGVRELLADDGVFVCQAISGADMIYENAFDQVLHEHLCYYTARSFRSLMQRHGLELFDVKHHPIHGGTNEYHVGKLGVHPVSHDVSRSAIQGAIELVEIDDCAAFARRVLTIRDELLAVLNAYRTEGKLVWAYGAPGKGGTLLNSFGIGRDLVQCATEANPLKYGLCIPGCRIPIVPESDVKPDAFLVLAWNFLDEFLAKEQAFLADGGEFIVPVPDVRIIGKDRHHEASHEESRPSHQEA